MQKRRHLGLPHILFDALLLGAREHLFPKKAFGGERWRWARHLSGQSKGLDKVCILQRRSSLALRPDPGVGQRPDACLKPPKATGAACCLGL